MVGMAGGWWWEERPLGGTQVRPGPWGHSPESHMTLTLALTAAGRHQSTGARVRVGVSGPPPEGAALH